MSGGVNIFNINPIYTLPTEEVIYDSNSEVDFNVKPLQSTPALLRITENLQVSANIVPLHLADVFYLPPAKKNEKNYHPKITTEGTTIIDKFHQRLYTEMFEAIQKNEKNIAKKNRNNK